MNERIKALAQQAGDSIPEFHFGDYNIPNEFIEKFAELIVRECADVGSKFSMAHPEAIRYQIKRHFGVRE